MAALYILQLNNGKYYVGSTTDYQKRFIQHQSGLCRYTSKFLPLKLVFHQEYKTYKESRKAEIWLKKQKDKSFIERIIKKRRRSS
ncbi:hypothetical protein A2160_06115 [Candidatus Beckwithbacteria bacterium RBG_13_42_9]|uniref:GIY-YIG domain-containing protein n=1 Tax=Candidatus Beckwithbacteria bacterium RBG_13_42_9 TaxID=1797457 RepID=A0A1F5E5A6_9BACT|nr:MAG: hypothetical protein A2160_06115 [Candidatus Beckwithbacteria bacterium RBG_13_42_9]